MRWEDSPTVWAGFGVGVRFPAGSRLLQWGGGHPQGRAGLGYHLESLPPAATVKERSRECKQGWRECSRRRRCYRGGTWTSPAAAAAPSPGGPRLTASRSSGHSTSHVSQRSL